MAHHNLPDFDKLWNYNDAAGTGEKFEEILPLAESSGNNDYLAELITQIGRTLGLQMKFDEAHRTLDRAESLIGDSDNRPKLRLLLERGRTYNSSGVYDKAKEQFLEAYNLGLKIGEDNLTIDAAHMMGIVEKGNESLRWNEAAIKHAEQTGDERAKKWLGALYNNTGWTYHDLGDFEKALSLFEKNVAWHTERNSKFELIIAKWCAARALRSLNEVDLALQKQFDLKKEVEDKGYEEDGYIFEEIGECLLLLNRGDEARPYFRKAYEILSKNIWLAANEKQRLDRLKSLGE